MTCTHPTHATRRAALTCRVSLHRATDVDLIFVKVKERDEKKIEYLHFLVALALLAERKGVSAMEIEEQVRCFSCL